jgi:hypothetical protein
MSLLTFARWSSRQPGPALRLVRPPAVHPLPQRGLGQIQIRATLPTFVASSSTRRTARALKSSSNRRRGRRLGVSAIGRDIVSTFRKISTKQDQAQSPRPAICAARLAARQVHVDARNNIKPSGL